ncbi:MAG: sensor histidine kinase, partial [Deltaproteobacteria bacterium]
SQFVSSVTHELRTPLVATQKALDVVITKAAGPVNQDQDRFLGIARRNLDRLYALINDILDLSKLEAGKMKMAIAPANVEQMVAEVCSSLGSWANSKSIQLNKFVAADLPMVAMDADRIVQVLNNLVSNALKFTPQGGTVTVEARLRPGGQHAEFSVQDSGIGIAPEDLGRVFEKFLQVGERRHTDVSGTGLGLSIAKEIVEHHGGRIWAESEKGQGARFVFILPVQGPTA